MAIVGISGSPIRNGNTDRLTKAILSESGKETKFINLSTLAFGSCRACAHNCATTAMCGVKDGLHPYLKDIRNAEALVIASPRHHGNMTSWMHSFFSRLWCFLHENKTLHNKPVLFVATGIGGDNGSAAENTFRASFIKEHKFNELGYIYYRSLIPPCLKCGAGHYCQWGGLWGMVGKNVEALNNFEFTPDKFRRWEDDPAMVDEVKKYGSILSGI